MRRPDDYKPDNADSIMVDIWGGMCLEYNHLCPTCVAWDLYYPRNQSRTDYYIPSSQEVQDVIRRRNEPLPWEV